MIKLAMIGASGRMGRQILTLAARDKSFQIVGALESANSSALGKTVGDLIGVGGISARVTSNSKEAFQKADVVIDFSLPESTMTHVKEAARHKCGLVIGTTGLSDAQKKTLQSYGKKIPIVFAPNMSSGVNLLFKLAFLAAQTLPKEYEIEILDVHHIHKKDSPSGTALELARQAANGRKIPVSKIIKTENEQTNREKGKIFILSKREGEVVGDHTVSLISEGEQVELTHRAHSRDAFASGALKAAQFVSKKKKGFFNMQDVLGLK